jgi:hypothetical protein
MIPGVYLNISAPGVKGFSAKAGFAARLKEKSRADRAARLFPEI